MKDARPALRYAKAILSLAKEKNIETEVNDDMKLILETIDSSEDLQLLIKSPVTKGSEKKNILDAVFGEKVPDGLSEKIARYTHGQPLTLQ